MAYMGKPVIYYSFAEGEGLPHGCRFGDEAGFPGGARFGEITDDMDLLVDRIISHMSGSRTLCEDTARRAGAYFAHTGGGNRERIYGILLGEEV
jgi:hypothetical protein